MGDFYASLDLGQSSDYSALTIIEQIDHPTYNPSDVVTVTSVDTDGPRWGRLGGGDLMYPERKITRRVLLLPDGSYGDVPPDDEQSYDVRHVQRWPLGTSYPRIVDDTVEMMSREPLKSNGVLVIDQTGVGAAVGDLFNQHSRRDFSFARVLITGGNTPHRDPETGIWHVPKTDLVSTVQVLLQSRRLRFPPASKIPEVEALIAELGTFKSKINIATGHEAFEAWRTQDHDDLVLSLAMGLWFAEKCQFRVRAL